MGMIIEYGKLIEGATQIKDRKVLSDLSQHPLYGLEIKWYNYPLNTQCFAIVVDDPSQVKDPVYYLAYDIPVECATIDRLEVLGNSVAFDLRKPLRIRVYALKGRTNLPPGASVDQLRRAMEGKVVATGQQWLSLQVH